VHALGADFVALRGGAGSTVLVSLEAVAQIRTRPGAGSVAGDRAVRLDRRFGDVLGELAADRPDVVIGTAGAELRGELRAVGRDVVTLRVHGTPPCAAYVALHAADEVRVG
jgi:hypothetical protein